MGRYKLPYTVFKRGKYWYYRTYTIEGVRTTPKSTGCRTKGEAVQFCEHLLLAGTLNDSNITFFKYAHNFFNDDSFYITDRITPLSDNTIKGHRVRYNAIIEPFFKDYKLKDITYIELKKFRASLIEKELKVGTIKAYLSTLKIIIESAYKEDLISKNPFDKLENLEEIKEEEKSAFTLYQVKQLYEKIDSEYKNLVLLLALTGMRINEALGVTAEDLFVTEQNTNYIKLTKQITNDGEYVRIKTKRNRVVPIITEMKVLVGSGDLRYKTTYRYFRTAIIELFGIETDLSIHSLRHFFVTNAKSKNINNVKVKIISGHALEKTERSYTNFTADDLVDILPWQKETLKLITE